MLWIINIRTPMQIIASTRRILPQCSRKLLSSSFKKVRIIPSFTLSMYGNVLEYIKFNHVNVYFMLYNMYCMRYQSKRHTPLAIVRTFVPLLLFTFSRQAIQSLPPYIPMNDSKPGFLEILSAAAMEMSKASSAR